MFWEIGPEGGQEPGCGSQLVKIAPAPSSSLLWPFGRAGVFVEPVCNCRVLLAHVYLYRYMHVYVHVIMKNCY